MYNKKQLENFFDKVHLEASEAAQKIYDKYTPELKERLLNQMGEGHKMYFGMGAVSIEGLKSLNKANNLHGFGDFIADNTEYWDKVRAGFNMETLIK